MNVFLIAVTAGFLILIPEFPAGWRRISIGFFAGGLIVIAASLLTKMRLQLLAAIEKLDKRG